MGSSSLVRFSRDGDQFHYLWAARRCLHLLPITSDLIAIAIEGPSIAETSPVEPVEAGEEIIDIAEYYGSEDLTVARLIRYLQLKHSTQNSGQAWTASGLKKTVLGFVARYQALESKFGVGAFEGRLEFVFVTNRPVAPYIIDAVSELAAGRSAASEEDGKTVEELTGLAGAALTTFCRHLRFEGNQDGYFEQRNILVQDLNGYLADGDVDAPVQLKELITKKALSESEESRTISKIDVLRALKTDEGRLFPAPCLIETADAAVPREQEKEFIAQIVGAANSPVVVHAEGGVGKSIFASRIKLGLPEGSACVVYDCFGNGRYRSLSGYRHRHKDALVQISNELAGAGLCHPLIPTPNADAASYVRAFLYRLTQAASVIRARNRDALVCIVVDAADNAEMAAREASQSGSFAPDLLREILPEGVRLVMLCRTHRLPYLKPPPNLVPLSLASFSRAETASLLLASFPDATSHDIDEFHRLSSQNPRVQATALSQGGTLAAILRRLGPNPTTVEDTLAALLNGAVAKLRDEAGSMEQAKIDAICSGLAALRPLIPISVLAAIAGVDATAVKSFALDLGRPLIVIGDTVQFFDEPAETWFRERFKPKADELAIFVGRLRTLTANSAYVASTLPQLMLEAGLFSELVDLALTSTALPEGSPIERRDVEMQRLQFALKASLRAKRYKDAAKIALKAGGEAAADDRQQTLIRENTDLASVLIEVDGIQELVARRAFGGGWMGSHHVYEAGFMSGRQELMGDARSRLRMAHEWLRNWSQLPESDRDHERITDKDVAELAMAHLNIHGPEDCAYNLRTWTPRQVSMRAGSILAHRLIDHGRFEELDALAVAAGNNLWLIFAIAAELHDVQRQPPDAVIGRALRLLLDPRVTLKDKDDWRGGDEILHAVVALVEAGRKIGALTDAELASIMERYLPSVPRRGMISRHQGIPTDIFTAYALHAGLLGRSIELVDLANPELKEELEKGAQHSSSQEARDFKFYGGAVLPWCKLRVWIVLGEIQDDKLDSIIADAVSAASKGIEYSYREDDFLLDKVARLWVDILAQCPSDKPDRVASFVSWYDGLKRPLYASTLIDLARVAGRHDSLRHLASRFAVVAFEITDAEREDAEAKANTFVSIARAILTTSQADAGAYFNSAVEVASKIGDENLARWEAVIELANRGGDPKSPEPEAAYKLARCGEVTWDYVVRDKHFDWDGTIKAITRLSPSSILAISSRWRDRGFGHTPRILASSVEELLEAGAVEPRSIATLFAFRADWEANELLQAALDGCESQSEREAVGAYLYHFMRFSAQSAQKWEKTKAIMLAGGATAPDIDAVINFSARRELSGKRSMSEDHDAKDPVSPYPEKDWTAIFDGVDLLDSNDLSGAYERFRATEPPYFFERFFEQAGSRVKAGKEPEFVRALGGMATFDEFDMRTLLDQLPADWKSRPAIKTALREILKSVCRRHPLKITRTRYRQIIPLQRACEISGAREEEIIVIVLDAIGERADITGASSLFNLVGLLIPMLTKAEALDVLHFGLGAFDAVLKDRDGDGPWVPALTPPADTEEAVAGYIWAGLAAPNAAIRWEAAHAVRGVASLGRTAILRRLVELAETKGGAPFADAGLHFYQMHGRQWLMMAIARIAIENPSFLLPHWDYLKGVALGGEDHVLIRGDAAAAALCLIDGGYVTAADDVGEKLRLVNVSPFPTEISQRYERKKATSAQQDAKEKEAAARFHFGIDIGPYWFDNLGRCFAVSQTKIEAMAAEIILDEWGMGDLDHWNKDERLRRKIFTDRENAHSHGSYPSTDDLRFYLSYHAMMIAAGRLLASTPLHQGPDDEQPEFLDWLKRHWITRPDGKWMSDRRDPEPLIGPDWKDAKAESEWRWSVAKSDFDRVLGLGSPVLIPWGSWTARSGQREESVDIRSAMVSPDNSDALLRALQTTADPHDYYLPSADDERQAGRPGFQLKGWVTDDTLEGGIDRLDPWAGDIRFPGLLPAAVVSQTVNLVWDSEGRTGSIVRQGSKVDVAWSEVWGERSEKEQDEQLEYGRKLSLSFDVIQDMLRHSHLDLIVKVGIERKTRRYSYEKYEHEEYYPPYTRVFLVKSDGEIYSL